MRKCICSICSLQGHDSRFHRIKTLNKPCKLCRENKDINDFHWQIEKRSGKKYHSCYCKICDAKRARERKASSPLNRIKSNLLSAKHRAFCDVSPEEVLEIYDSQGGRCFYTGEILELSCNSKNVLSIDRIDPEKNYTKDNIVLCTKLVNTMKSNLKIEDFERICKIIYETLNSRRREKP